DPGAVVYDAVAAARSHGIDVVIADTAGRLPTQLHLMEEIGRIKRVIAKAEPGAPHEVWLVLDANTGQNALNQVKAFDDALGLTGQILTKLVGHSGAGKTTLHKLIAAIERANRGAVLVNGQSLSALRPAALAFLRHNLGLVFQGQKQLFDRSVFDNVMLPLVVTGQPYREAARRARAALDKVGLLQREKANPVTLSGGEQQRLCVARAVVNLPSSPPA